ncbi:MAG: NAD(P)H-hydrate dehydratase [Acidobacteria bacterium]|nr:NAD(P)H-hydrate dehydratase [Acidobacteriota bacterium]
MIRGVGIDLVDVDRFRRTLERRPGLIDRLFTAEERAYAHQQQDPTQRLAARFAAKEATLKALGIGIGAVGWREIEVGRDPDGRPSLLLHGRAAALAQRLGLVRLTVSLTHTDITAAAEVIALGGPGRRRRSQWREAATGELGDRRAAPLDPLLAGGSVPVVTPDEMAAIDRDAPEPVAELIERAAAAVARHAVRMMGGTYGRRVVVLVGRGNNGNDGRVAAARLRARGVRVQVIDLADAPPMLPGCDLLIDAALGTGFHGSFDAPLVPDGAAVLAVDIPSGVDGVTGEAGGRVLVADETLTFAALKPGLLFADGTGAAGRITVADIGLDVSRASIHVVGAQAAAAWVPSRPLHAHKWSSAVCIVAGGPGMGGAASLCARAALRSGAGYVRLATPAEAEIALPTEVVTHRLPTEHWAAEVLADLPRFRSLVIGNGLGTDAGTVGSVLEVLAGASRSALPTVADADALSALATLDPTAMAAVLGPHCVLTPHDGEFARLSAGAPVGPDRIGATRALARRTGAVVLLKGPTTVVAAPDGRVLLSTTGDARLATAGTGDVLAGIIGALLAEGADPFRAAAAGAFIHGRAGVLGWRSGAVAGDLPWRIPGVRDELAALAPRSTIA